LGRFIVQALLQRGVPESALFIPRRAQHDLKHEEAVKRMYDDAQCDVVIHLAAVVGGIGANRAHPGQFFYENMAMGLHMIEEARRRGIRKFVQVGTVCSYPKFCPVPFREDDLWHGYPEETNAPYGLAKRALIVMLDAYKREYGLNSAALIPVNLYGPGDNFDPATSHVIPALIDKIETARRQGHSPVTCWGTGNASREFLYVADAAEAIVRALEQITVPMPINLGTGREIPIRELAAEIAAACGFDGEFQWDANYPDGQPRRWLNTERAEEMLNWRATTPLREGLQRTVAWYRDNVGNTVGVR